MNMKAEILFDEQNFIYTKNEIEFSGCIRNFNTGRCIDYKIDVYDFSDSISEKYFSDNYEDIENEIVNQFIG